MSVIGAGVIGLSVAARLAVDGYRVMVVADQPASETVSAVAGAIWFPHLIDGAESTIGQLRTARERFEELATDPPTGVVLRDGVHVERRPDADRGWTAAVDTWEPVPAGDLPVGATGAVRARLPVVDMGRYLDWLHEHCRALDVGFTNATVDDLANLAGSADVVVVAAGLRSPDLLGDDTSLVPVRGQVLRLRNSGLTEWLIDDENPAGMLYVLPRIDDIVVGGTSETGRTDLVWDEEVEVGILERAVAAVPELAGLEILGRSVGLRPTRPSLRVEHVAGWPVSVIACYGHGGAGVSTSWGSADAVAALVADLSRR